MRAEERQHRILGLARQSGRVEVADAAVEFGVARETVRRDLSELERRGLIRRTHGAAYPVESAGFETTLARRETEQVAEKRRIAAAAATLVGEAETVFVDEGYTPELVAMLLPTDRPLTVITASLRTASLVAASESATVLLAGGRVRSGTQATVGSWARDMLARFVIDLAFLGANGVSREHGLTTPDPAVAEVKEQAVRSSRRRVLVGVHSKFGASSFCRFAEVSDFDTIVTDAGLSAPEAHRYSLLGPQVLRV
ncbi:DeoR/GlpR family DNA-binding transcription regulator [Streptomyces sp. NPDC048506]|uniref:DeoR/GlpR family DNA-binding transcription regulator n=1 Tax=Streptomyces sp. NPDC048506 TaxID=3155028 RepID=UPI00342FF3A9